MGFSRRWSLRHPLGLSRAAGCLAAALAADGPADCGTGSAPDREKLFAGAKGWERAAVAQTLCEASARSHAQCLARPPSLPDEERLDCFRCGLYCACRLPFAAHTCKNLQFGLLQSALLQRLHSCLPLSSVTQFSGQSSGFEG